MAYATVEDLEARWRTLDSDEEARSAVLLDDASVMLTEQVEVDPEDTQQAALLKIVCCNMVIRAMLASESDAYGVSQIDYGMGPFSQAAHFANPNGDLYLTGQEKDLLDIGTGRYILDFRPQIGGSDA